MPRYVAFLRAINVGGAHTVKMDSLRRAFEPLGFAGVETFIASGNVMFETSIRSAARLEHMIGNRFRAEFGYELAAFVRTRAQLQTIVAYKAFPTADFRAAALNIVLLSASPDAASKKKLQAFQTATDEFRVHGREIYWLRRKMPGAVPYSTVPLDKVLQPPFTIRSYNTLAKIAAKA